MTAESDFGSSTFGFLAWGFAGLALAHSLLVPQFPGDSLALLLGYCFLAIFGVFADEDSRIALYSWAVLPVGGILYAVLQGESQSLSGLFTVLCYLCVLGSLICHIFVVVKMFQNGQSGWGIASLVLLLACGIGLFVAFFYGWSKSTKWRMDNVMWVWTGCLIGSILFGILSGVGITISSPSDLG